MEIGDFVCICASIDGLLVLRTFGLCSETLWQLMQTHPAARNPIGIETYLCPRSGVRMETEPFSHDVADLSLPGSADQLTVGA